MTIVLQSDKLALLTAGEADENIRDLRDGDTRYTPKGRTTTGIKVDPDAPDYGWHDLTSALVTDHDDANRAVWQPYIGGIRKLRFDTPNAEAFASFHIPHDYAMNTTLFIHVHWSHASATLTGGSCTWGFEVTYAKGHQQAPFTATKTVTVLQNANTTQYQHMIAETALTTAGGSGTQLDTAEIEVDGIVECRLFLDSNDLTDSVTVPNPFAHFVDIHYQSTGVPTKQKAPDFWT